MSTSALAIRVTENDRARIAKIQEYLRQTTGIETISQGEAIRSAIAKMVDQIKDVK